MKKREKLNEELSDEQKKEVQNSEEIVDNIDKMSEEQEEAIDEDTDNEVEELKQKNEELRDKNLRLMAEFDNYRKRTLNEKSELIKTASERVFVDILPLIDDFERALGAMEQTSDVASVKEGVGLIYSKFISFLKANGVKEIPTDNEKFDMDLHEAVTTFPAQDEEQKGKIIECLSKGYTLNDKVIRFPKVVVGE